MPRNVEIKAKVPNLAELALKAKSLCDGAEPTVLRQLDTFFRSSNGFLKLREFVDSESPAELIYYERPHTEGPKLSQYVKTTTADPDNLKEALGRAMGIVGEVVKTRRLHIYGQTRIHLDEVKNLGEFLELEVCLNDDQSLEEGERIAHDLLEMLEIPKDWLLKGAYMEAISQQSS